jgi:RNA polymerase sigma-70 factor (ECF subfamily)
MQAVNERELIERCHSGDERAFQELVDRFKDLVFALISRTVQDRSRAEDLAQDVFLRIHRGLPYFRGEARLSTGFIASSQTCAPKIRRVEKRRSRLTTIA